MVHGKQSDQTLHGKRLLVSGKGGSGKSTLTALMATVLHQKAYEVMVLDGDASNPEGLIRLLFGLGAERAPKPLIEFFGGLDVVTCPVDDPSPLTRINDSRAVTRHRIDLRTEVPSEYYLQRGGTILLQVGKIQTYGQGCDGPLEKVVRDFLVVGDAVSLIDMKAGVEHFGRRIPDHMDVVLGVLDTTLETISISGRMAELCREGNIGNYWLVLNKVGSGVMEQILMKRLGELRNRVLGTIPFDDEVLMAGLMEQPLTGSKALEQVGPLVDRLEQAVSKEGRQGPGVSA